MTTIKRTFLSRFRFMVNEVVADGRFQRVWLYGPFGAAVVSNIHNAETMDSKAWNIFRKPIATSQDCVESSELLMGDINIPPRSEFNLEVEGYSAAMRANSRHSDILESYTQGFAELALHCPTHATKREGIGVSWSQLDRAFVRMNPADIMDCNPIVQSFFTDSLLIYIPPSSFKGM